MTIPFTSAQMLEALERVPRPTTFLRQLLVKKVIKSDEVNFVIDRDIGTQAKATYVAREGDAELVPKDGYSSTLVVAPYVAEYVSVTPKDLDVRLPGESNYAAGSSKQEVLAKRVGRWLAGLDDRLVRLEEQQLSEALETGKIAVTGKGVGYEIDYGATAGNFKDVSSTGPWSTATTDILSQLGGWADDITSAGGYVPTALVMGAGPAAGFLGNTAIKAMLDNRAVQMGVINPKQLAGQRATYLGQLNWDGFSLDIYTYRGGYMKDVSGTKTWTPFMPAKKVFVVSEAIDLDMGYGRIDNFNHGSFMGERFPHIYADARGKTLNIELESSPLPLLRDNKSFICATVLGS